MIDEGNTRLREQAHVAKRNATEADLAAAQKKYVGQTVWLPGHKYARFTCVGVRLDEIKRLIFDLVRELPKHQEESCHEQN